MKRYDSGSPCRHGHVGSPRYTSNHVCVECSRLQRAKRTPAKPFTEEQRERYNATKRAKYADDPESYATAARERLAAMSPTEREQYNEARRDKLKPWTNEQRERYNATTRAKLGAMSPTERAASAAARRTKRVASGYHERNNAVRRDRYAADPEYRERAITAVRERLAAMSPEERDALRAERADKREVDEFNARCEAGNKFEDDLAGVFDQPLVSHALAKALSSNSELPDWDLTRFYTGEPCKNGHVAERAFPSGRCMACRRIRDRKDRMKRRGVPERMDLTKTEQWELSEWAGSKRPGMWEEHIVPLFGKHVNGLDYTGNLEFSTPAQNLAKGWKYDDASGILEAQCRANFKTPGLALTAINACRSKQFYPPLRTGFTKSKTRDAEDAQKAKAKSRHMATSHLKFNSKS